MKELKSWSLAVDKQLPQRKILAFDLDDTLTHHGELPAQVHEFLEKMRDQDYRLVLVTGRSAGWVDALVKLLPFDAVVGENGALLYYWPNQKLNRRPREECSKLYWSEQGYSSSIPTDVKDRHAQALEKIMKSYPGVRVASDQLYRIYDLAIDFAEEVESPLDFKEAAGIQQIFEDLGAVAKVSSIHVNGWWGSFNKELGLRQLVEKIWQEKIERDLIYVGDSPNDGPLFGVAAVGIGVANIRDFETKLKFNQPHYVASKRGAAGAVEIMQHLLAARLA